MSLGPWSGLVGAWSAQTEKWDVINFSFSGTLQAEVRLSSLPAFTIAHTGTLQLEVQLNSPPEFPVITMSGTFQIEAYLSSVVDYALWVEETPKVLVWEEESAG